MRQLADALAPVDEDRQRLSAAAPGNHPDGDPSPTPSAWVPRQLPADVSAFTGRTEQLGRLDATLAGDNDRMSAVVITAIGGRRGRQDRAGGALGAPDGRPVPRGAAVCEPARLRPRPADGGG